jgi:DNA-nicking Smr family endonuclease
MGLGDGRRGRVLSSEERVLWMAVTKSVVPLDEPSQTENASRPVSENKPSKTSVAKSARMAPLPTEKKRPPLAPLGRRAKQRVARGKETIDGRLDLHGLTQNEAYIALLRFLRMASARGARIVLVITGKGVRGGDGERGVLKRQVPQWLGLPEFRMLVVGFEDAHVTHGGEGALYVRVRRSKLT